MSCAGRPPSLHRRLRRTARRGDALLVAIVALAVTSCSDETGATSGDPANPPDAGSCSPGELTLDSGECLAAGMQESGCPAGEVAVDGGGCRAAGVPQDGCGKGFVSDDDAGCVAVLPASPCGDGEIALPGERACHRLAPCAAGTWGDIPADASTQFVDVQYAGGSSDGSQSKPWTGLQEAVDAAPPDAIVAVAAGSYPGDVIVQGKPVRIWGRCPDLVEIVAGDGDFAAISVQSGASGAELRSLSLRGASRGAYVSGSEDVLIDRVWVHDTALRGIVIQDDLGPTSVVVTASLVERAHTIGVFDAGCQVTVEGSVVRLTLPAAEGVARGVNVQRGGEGTTGALVVRSSFLDRNHDSAVFAVEQSQLTVEASLVRGDAALERAAGIHVQEGSSLAVRSSVVEDVHYAGIMIMDATGLIEQTVVRNTLPVVADGTLGVGIAVVEGVPTRAPSTATIKSCKTTANRFSGIIVVGSDAEVDASLVSDTLPGAADGNALGVLAIPGAVSLRRSTLAVRSSRVERGGDTGIAVGGSDLTMEGTAVRDAQPAAGTGKHGTGVAINDDLIIGQPAKATIRSSLVAGSHQAGLQVSSSDVLIEATAVVDTLGELDDGQHGVGAFIGTQLEQPPFGPNVTMRGCLFDRNKTAGIMLFGGFLELESTLVRDTRVQQLDGGFGDGVVAIAGWIPSAAVVSTSRIEQNVRAGIASFGAHVDVGDTVLECNAIALNGEQSPDASFAFIDLGGNSCGCGADRFTCTVQTSNLAVPPPLPVR